MTMHVYCNRDNAPYKVMDNFVRNILKKIVRKFFGNTFEDIVSDGEASYPLDVVLCFISNLSYDRRCLMIQKHKR